MPYMDPFSTTHGRVCGEKEVRPVIRRRLAPQARPAQAAGSRPGSLVPRCSPR